MHSAQVSLRWKRENPKPCCPDPAREQGFGAVGGGGGDGGGQCHPEVLQKKAKFSKWFPRQGQTG